MSAGDIRVGDAERHSAVTALGVHLANGRLKPAEHEKRCVLADIALTRGELTALFADLPAPHPDLSSTVPVRMSGNTSKGFQFAVGFALIIALPTAVMQVVYLGGWWMFVVVAAILLVATAAEVTRRQRV